MKPFRMKLAVILLLSLGLSASSVVGQQDRGAALPPEALPEEVKDLDIKDYYLPSSAPQVGVINKMLGHMVVIHRATQEAYFAMAGDPIHENDLLTTLNDSRCRIRFTNEDVVAMAPETRFSVENYEDNRKEGKKTSLFGMLKGKAMFYALRLFKYDQMRYSVKTPTAVCGVRGTKFGMHVYRLEGEKQARAGVQVADSGRDIGLYLAEGNDSGDGGQGVTVVATADGNVDVNGVPVGPGEVYNSYTEQKVFDPSALNNIESSTGGTPGEDTGDTGDDTGGGSGQQSDADMGDLIAGRVNQETGGGTEDIHHEEGGTEGQTYPVTHGYFAAMLTEDSDGVDLRDVFISQMGNEFGTSSHYAGSIIDSDYLLWSGDFSYVTTGGGTANSISITTTATVLTPTTSPARLQEYDYLAFGYWTHTGSFSGSGTFTFVDKSWWIQGYGTPCAVVEGLTGSVPYSGEAHGTMWHSGSAYDLSGTFGCTANFTTDHIQDFTMNATGAGGRAAYITGAGGDISGCEFDVSGGIWRLKIPGTELEPCCYHANGQFFGPGAEEIGGVWGMHYDGDLGAAGVFGGKR